MKYIIDIPDELVIKGVSSEQAVKLLMTATPISDGIRLKGKWIKYNPPIPEKDDGVEAWDCSVCSAMVSYPTNYCPNCGARMEEEE